VEQAILEGRVVTLQYVDRNGAVSDRMVEPLAVVGDAPHWYLWGWCRLRDEPRAFRIDRIRGAALHEEIAPDRSLDIDTHFPVATGTTIFDDV
jgi:predicted DNA-binding transcriptional regulator YafY